MMVQPFSKFFFDMVECPASWQAQCLVMLKVILDAPQDVQDSSAVCQILIGYFGTPFFVAGAMFGDVGG